MLEVSHLSKSFGKVKAVKDLSFRVKKGEILGLIGPNGCGKTTTLKCICTLLKTDSGTIRINGHDIAKEPVDAKRKLGYVPELPDPLPYLTIDEQIEFTARIFEIKGWKNKADEMIRHFDLEEKRNDLAKTLSKGQMQKLNIICALIHEPNVILLDEPLYGIDPKGGRYIRKLITMAKGNGASIVISSHNLWLVEELATKFLIMKEGSMVLEGTYKEIMRKTHGKMGQKLEDIFIEITEDRKVRSD